MSGKKGMKWGYHERDELSYLDYKVRELEKHARLLAKIRTIMNAIKTNCLYSDKQMVAEAKRMEMLKASEEEKEVLTKLMLLRRKLGKELMEEARKLIEEVENSEEGF